MPGYFPRWWSSIHGTADDIRTYLTNNKPKDINEVDHKGETILWNYCSQGGDIEIIKVLLDFGVDVKLACGNDTTVLKVLANYHINEHDGTPEQIEEKKEKHRAAVKLILDSGCDPNYGRGDPAFVDVIQGNERRVRKIKDAVERMEAYSVDLVMAQMLLDAGADINKKCFLGRSAATWALEIKSYKVQQWLAARGAHEPQPCWGEVMDSCFWCCSCLPHRTRMNKHWTPHDQRTDRENRS